MRDSLPRGQEIDRDLENGGLRAFVQTVLHMCTVICGSWSHQNNGHARVCLRSGFPQGQARTHTYALLHMHSLLFAAVSSSASFV